MPGRPIGPAEAAQAEQRKLQKHLERPRAHRVDRIGEIVMERDHCPTPPLQLFFNPNGRRNRFFRDRAEWRKRQVIQFQKPFTLLRKFHYIPNLTHEAANLEVNLDSSVADKVLKWASTQIY